MSIFRFLKPKPKVDSLSGIALRPYRQTDHAKVLSLIESRFDELGSTLDLTGSDIDLSDIEKYWREPGGEFVVLTRDNVIVGCLCAKPLPDRPHTAEFDWYFLDKRSEGKGLGLILVRWAMQWCLEHNIKTVELWSSEKRKRTHQIYRKLGFHHNGIRKRYREDPPQDVLYFELDGTNPATIQRVAELLSRIPSLI